MTSHGGWCWVSLLPPPAPGLGSDADCREQRARLEAEDDLLPRTENPS